MKKVWFLLIFLILAGASFAEDADGRYIFVEGIAVNEAQRLFFLDNFRMEGGALGYIIVDNRAEAGYTFRFEVFPNIIIYDDGSTAPAPPDEGRYVIMITLVRNYDGFEMSSFGFAFSELEEMYSYNQYLFFRAVVSIPLPETDPYQAAAQARENDDWRNKLLYLRASVDYPIRFYLLNDSELIGGVGISGVWGEDALGNTQVAPLDNRFVALPGLTVGLEVHFLNWMSIEPVFQVSLGDPDEILFFNMSAGVFLKFPIKTMRDAILSPYGAFSFPLNKPSLFAELPFSLGAGLQVAVKAGDSGAAFLDVGFMYTFGDVIMHNRYGPYFSNPSTIAYRHITVTIGLGYKYGLVGRR